MAVRLKDVAERASVSVKTVSNVVNGYPHVTDALRARVQRAIAELNYVPNLSARNLRNGRSGLIALALPELDVPYFAEIARLIVKAAGEHGFTVLIDQTSGEREREQLFISGIRSQLIDGLIFTPLALGREDLLKRRDPIPLVLLGETIDDGLVNHVAINSVKAGAVATRHLIELGRKRIAAIGNPLRMPSASAHTKRLVGYYQAHLEAGLTPDKRLVIEVSSFHTEEGARAMTKLIQQSRPPDAVFCFNDLLALGAIRTLLSNGYRVPEDVAVVGFDDIEIGKYTTPTLTSIAPDKVQLATMAVNCLMAQLASEKPKRSEEGEVNFALIARESTLGRKSVTPEPKPPQKLRRAK